MNYRNFWHIIILILTLSSQKGFSQVYINEFLASNASIIEDPDFQDDADWIELYNDGTELVNLRGYYITDNLNKTDKWEFKEDIYIEPKGFILIWADGNSSGIHTNFKLSADGEDIGLFGKDQKPLDTLRFSTQQTDVSRGRILGEPDNWGYFTIPTPNGPNNTDFFESLVFNIPEMEPAGGLFPDGIVVEILNKQTGMIRYTLDGSEPDINSDLYSGPVDLEATTVIRARIFNDLEIPGPVITHSYFIGNDFEQRKLPLISIASNPDNFWDPDIGIYVQDYKPDWEIPVNIELFESSITDRAEFNLRAGVKINGLYSWQLPQKMLGVYFRKRYGSDQLDYPVMMNSFRSSYENFALRASGSDWSYTLFRDILGQQATRLNMNLDISASRPCIVFFNGEYMGIHNMREKIESDYIEENHGLENGSFDMVENQDYAEAGDLQNYQYLQELLAADLSDQANFNKVADEMDVENFTDLVITELAVANTSISHNVMAWKPKSGGKWKWIVMDLDRGFFNPSDHLIDFYLNEDVWPFKALFDNEAYRAYFAKRLSDQLYTTFHPARMEELIDMQTESIEAEIEHHIDRWAGTTSSYGNAMPSKEYWLDEICALKSFVKARPKAVLSDLQTFGFDQTANLGLSVYPGNGGILALNELAIPGSVWNGPYLKNMALQIRASALPGYRFTGWKNSSPNVLVPKGSVWKYLDNGSDQGTDWFSIDFDDGSWEEGPAQLGYGDGDENTELYFGDDVENKYLTTYFRHTFMLDDSLKNASSYILNILRDDGAIVYVNGKEIIRDNISCGAIDYLSTAITYIGGQSESTFISYLIDASHFKPGSNLIAVEIHQSSGNSSDISFDLELIAYLDRSGDFISTDKILEFSLSQDLNLMAVFEPTSNCLIPSSISQQVVLQKSCSPYFAQGDISILEDGEMIVEPGVEIFMPGDANIFVHGKLNATGSEEERIVFKLNPADETASWGALNFENTTQNSILSFVTIEDASTGPFPLRKGAINAFNADLELDNLIIEKVNGEAILSRYSNILLTNSLIHSKVSGDLINVKYGSAMIGNCQFIGNANEDVDAIDFDGIENGTIKNCIISSCTGINNDAIDIGENSTNILIDSVFIYNIFDKGISVGQGSNVTIKNSIITQCDMGVGVKDSSKVLVDHTIFYATAYPIRCYEKNPGRAGGNAWITNSILSNSSEKSYEADSKSNIHLFYNISDNQSLPDNGTNLFGNPGFERPSFFDFGLQSWSPCINAGNDAGQNNNLGTSLSFNDPEPQVAISHIYVNALSTENPEFISLHNPSSQPMDLSLYEVTKGFTCIIPIGTTLDPDEYLYLTNNAQHDIWSPDRKVIEWQDGKLSNNGEQIELIDAHGIVIDYILYENDGKWPNAAFDQGEVMVLKDPVMDNHIPENWRSIAFDQLLTTKTEKENGIIVYPNPTKEWVYISAPGHHQKSVQIFSLLGHLLDSHSIDGEKILHLNLKKYDQKALIIKIEDRSSIVIIE